MVAGTSKAGGKCALWDAVEQRHADEASLRLHRSLGESNTFVKVKEAREQALAEYKRAHPDVVDDTHLKVDLPVAAPAPGVPAALPGPIPVVPNYAAQMAAMQAAAAHAQAQAHAWVMAQQRQALPPLPPIVPPAPRRRRAPKRR